MVGTNRSRHPLSRSECLSRVQNGREGRLGYAGGRGPRHLVVRYRAGLGGLVVHLPDYADAPHYLQDEPVVLNVTGRAESGEGWEVAVAGVGARVPEETVRQAGLTDSLEQWPSGVEADYFVIPATEVSGSRDG